jgi:hypothetical protein
MVIFHQRPVPIPDDLVSLQRFGETPPSLIAGPPKNLDAKHVHSIYPNIME